MKPHIFIPLFASLTISAQAVSYLTGGHIDAPAFGYDTVAGFEPHLHNEGGVDGSVIDGIVQTTESEYGPEDLVIVVPLNSNVTVSATNYYWLPETETQAATNGTPFLGIGLEELDALDWTGGTVTISLIGITGPGNFLLWQDDGFGGEVVFVDSVNDSFTLGAGSHTHFNWGFTEEGIYGLEFEISGNHLADGAQSASAIYTFQVPEPTTALMGALGMLGLLRRRRA